MPVEPAKSLPDAGVNTALRSSVPTGSAVVDVEAEPEETVTGVPISVGVPEPYSNWTVPCAADEATVAVRVTDVPANWGLAGVGVRVVVVGVPWMVKVSVPVEAAKPAVVGVNTALRSSVPTGRVLVGKVATPPLVVTGAPRSDPPFSNCTVPSTPGW